MKFLGGVEAVMLLYFDAGQAVRNPKRPSSKLWTLMKLFPVTDAGRLR